MSHHWYGWFTALPLLVVLLPAAARPAAAQVRAPGGVRVPGTTVAREAPLVNWSEVPASTFSLGYLGGGSFRIFSLETIDGSQHWVERSYHWAGATPMVDNTTVYPSDVRMVHAVTGYSQPVAGGGWYGYPTVRFAVLIPVASEPMHAPFSVRRGGPSNAQVDAAALSRIPAAQALGYQRVAAPPPVRRPSPAVCPASTQYPSNGPALQGSCLLLEPGQSVDLPNQIRILRVGDNYRIMVRGSLVDDLSNVTIIRTDAGRYYALRDLGQF